MGRVLIGTLVLLTLAACQTAGRLSADAASNVASSEPEAGNVEAPCMDFPPPAPRVVDDVASATTSTPPVIPAPAPQPLHSPWGSPMGVAGSGMSKPIGDRRVAAISWTEEERLCRQRRLQRARRNSNWITVGALGAMAAYGIAYYDYGNTNWQAKSDGWFEPSNKDGGADKTGHAVSTHIETAAFAWINRRLGIPTKEAALRGAIGAFAVSLTMEIGDGFSDQFGSSWTDIVANTVGCTFGYFHASDPAFARLLDLRWEYFPSEMALNGEISEYTTDIEGSAHLLAINVGALVSEQHSLWDLADIQIGYMARHYKDHKGPEERRPFIGVGLNVGNALRKIGLGKVAWFFDYYQVPFVSLRWSTDLNA